MLKYVLGLKDNQPILCQAIQEHFEAALESPKLFAFLQKKAVMNGGNGRTESRTYYLCTDRDFPNLNQDDWCGKCAVGMMKSKVKKDGSVTEENHYCITSLTNVDEFAQVAHSHWSVENSLHWCLDVTFREDHSRMRTDHAAENSLCQAHCSE